MLSSIFVGIKCRNGACLPGSHAIPEEDWHRLVVFQGHGPKTIFRNYGLVANLNFEILTGFEFILGLNEIVEFDSQAGGSAFDLI